MLHSNAPWQPSGYGRQCQLLAGLLRHLGHEVIISAISGLDGAPIEWDGLAVLPHGRAGFGVDVLVGHASVMQPDLIITLMDFYRLWPIAEQLREYNVAAWLPVDTTELSRPDRETLTRSGARPIAMSLHGQEALKRAGWLDAPYLPHMHTITAEEYAALAEQRADLRKRHDLADKFVIGICAANNDHLRKAFPEQLEAFRRFSKDMTQARMLIHTVTPSPGGLDLQELRSDLGLDELVKFTQPYIQVAGSADEDFMRAWFTSLDVLSSCSYGEGFGVPMLEAQACGTPAIGTRASAMQDPDRAQWLVEGTPFWNYVYRQWWTRPDIASITKAYNKAARYASTRRQAAREASAEFLVDNQLPAWEALLKELEPRG
jgi:glycosyltransferase involved in cell wall biosynthesis